MRALQSAVVLLVLSGCLLAVPGCASEQHAPSRTQTVDEFERPAVPLEEEETLSDKIGQVGVVLLVVGAVVVPVVLLLIFKPF
jgi:hypothetical protein